MKLEFFFSFIPVRFFHMSYLIHIPLIAIYFFKDALLYFFTILLFLSFFSIKFNHFLLLFFFYLKFVLIYFVLLFHHSTFNWSNLLAYWLSSDLEFNGL
jgi:hypothetical protein